MSTIPNSAMPHAGGTTTNENSSSQNRSGSQAGSFGSETRGSSQSGFPSGSSYRSPESYSRDADFYADRSRGGASLMERARDHKTGIAVGVAVGAIAAAAIPFMFGSKRKSAQYDREIYVDNRETARSGDTSARGTGESGWSGSTGSSSASTILGGGSTSGTSGSRS